MIRFEPLVTREILECFFDRTPIQDEYIIVQSSGLAVTNAHSNRKGSATSGSEEALNYKK
jgi:formate dehydrogenase